MGKGRVISLSSGAHRYMTHDQYEDFLREAIQTKSGPSEAKYNPRRNYGLSKICNIFFAREVHRRYNKEGVTACSCHPGLVMRSELSRNMKPGFGMLLVALGFAVRIPFMMESWKSLDQGAATTLRCVSLRDNELRGGHYYVNCQSGRDNGKLQGAC